MAATTAPRSASRTAGTLGAALGALLLSAGCAAARPSSASLAAEPVLQLREGAVVLGEVRIAPRRSRIGVPGRDGAVELVLGVRARAGVAADEVQRRHGDRYRFRRVDLGSGSPAQVELRGSSPTGAEVVVVTSEGRGTPIFGSPATTRPLPPDVPTSVVVTVISRQ